MDFPYVYRWDKQGCKGQVCKVLARGKAANVCEWPPTVKLLENMNSRLVEFTDGYQMVTSRNALKRR